MITRTHNAYHLGDNLIHLHFLRKVALANPDRAFVHAAQWQHLRQLQDVVSDVPNIELKDYNYLTPSDSIDAWRGANGFWYQSEIRNDFVKFHVEQWFPYLAVRMKVENPIKCAKDMLFDYPAIQKSPHDNFSIGCEVLVINSPPGSGQFTGYDQYVLGSLALSIADKGFKVSVTEPVQETHKNIRCTKTAHYSVTAIGHLALHCHTILMVSTGPSWPTFNVWNQESVKNRIILLDTERVNLSPNTMHATTIEEAKGFLKGAGLL